MPENALWACLLIIYAKCEHICTSVLKTPLITSTVFSNSVLVSYVKSDFIDCMILNDATFSRLNTRSSFRDRTDGTDLTPSAAGVNVSRSYNVEISHLDGSKTVVRDIYYEYFLESPTICHRLAEIMFRWMIWTTNACRGMVLLPRERGMHPRPGIEGSCTIGVNYLQYQFNMLETAPCDLSISLWQESICAVI
jgi:hypothetical protein